MNEYVNNRLSKSPSRKQAGCEGKKSYSSYSEAEAVMKAIASHSHKQVKPYKCLYCGNFHVGRPLVKVRRHK